MQKKLQLSLITVALVSSLQAENQYTLQNIEVTSSQGTSINKKDITDDVIVITKEEIEESRVTTLNEALNKLANMAMTQNGGPGTSSSIYVRGMSSKRILVLVDGVRYNNPTAIGAAAEFSQIMLNNVEQIEIIKGAQSGVWGSDASGGIINITTSNAKQGYHASLNLEYGTYNTLQTSLAASYATKQYDMLVSGTYFDNDGFSAAGPKQSEADYGKRYDDLGLEKDSYENKTLNTKFGYNFTDSDRVEANIQAINSFVHYDNGAGTANDSTIPNTYLQNRFYSLALKHQDSLNDITLQYNLSTFDRETVSQWGNYYYKGSVNEVKVVDKIDYMADSFLRVGASYQKFEQTDITPNIDKSYNAISAYATNYNKIQILADNNTIITESVRYDNYNSFENALTGKFGIKQFIKDDLYLSANIGTGYNAPTLGQLFGQWGANPNLKPEKSLTGDVSFGNDTLWITYFHNEIKDLIDYDWTLGYIQTTGKSTFKGVEIGYEDYYLDTLGLKALYTYLEAKDSDGKALARRPQAQVDVRATYYATNSLDFGLNAQYIGKRYDSADNQGAQTGKYTVIDFVTNVKANKYVTFYAKINNLTDKYYQTVDGYETAGRSLYVGLNAKY
ncbi:MULTISPECIES: TonB-dependent receptor [Sulfurimonas]|uniref:TonB-dependent receptor plug domain-containing protein n=1 Tax=Sulfurimonas TaxID=202746 RepID=UPI001264D6BE|nr:TonB-dependent receptor [Sulfurimonas indica]